MSLREAGKEKRRGRILAAAEKLILEHESVEFSMRELADAAGVAFVTPFNLFQSKGGVLLGLIEQRLQAHHARLAPSDPGGDPIERVVSLGLHAARAYTSDPALGRPLLRGLAALEDLRLSEIYGTTVSLWSLALRDAVEQGILDPDCDVELLARTLHITFAGAQWLWALDQISGAELERQVEYGIRVCLLARVEEPNRADLEARIRELERPRRRRAKAGRG